MEIKNKSQKLADVAGKVKDGDLQGFLIDLIKALAEEAKFDYDLYLRSDTAYQPMIDELTRQVLSVPIHSFNIFANCRS